MRIERRLKILVLALAGLALSAPAVAQAEPVQQFSFQVKDIKPGGRFTLIFSAHTFDTTGGVPPNPTENFLRLPAGAALRKQFLSKRYFCDGPALRDAINSFDFTGTPFTKRVANLKPFIRQLARSRSKREHKALANAQTCDKARIGFGTVSIDARATIPVLDQLIPGHFWLFFSGPTEPGAIAGFTALGAADEDSPLTQRYPIVAAVHAAVNANFINDPSPDGLFGYKLTLPTGNINGLIFSIAELSATTSGLTLLKGDCLKQNARGRCVQRQKRTLFWFNTPPCPASGSYTIQDFFRYEPPLSDITRTIALACPRFLP